MIQAWRYDSSIQSAYVLGAAIRAANCGNAGLTATSQHRWDRAEPNSAFRLEGYAFPMASLPPPPAGVPGWASAPARGSGPSRWTARVALLVAFLACILGVIGWFRPVAPDPVAAPAYSDEEVAAATAKVCAAFELVDRAVQINMGRNGHGDYATELAVAVNARQALDIGGRYLSSVIDEYPAAVGSLREAAGVLVTDFDAISIHYLADSPQPEVDRFNESGDRAADEIRRICR